MRLRRKNTASASADPISQNIDAVVAIHAIAESQVDHHQRTVESLTAWLGRPQFFYGILVGVSLWMIVNSFAHPFGLGGRDDPPFFWMQGAVGLGALLMTSVILITQNRQGKLAERREQLELQMSLLTEQRTAKIIDLLEELRRDMPSVRNRVDAEAEALTRVVDPQEVLAAFETKIEETLANGMTTESGSQLAAEQIEGAASGTQEEITQARREDLP